MTNNLVQPYDPGWPLAFLKIKAFLDPFMAGVATAIKHVGSTAVPGMTAKPVIDVIIVIASGTFEEIKRRLELKGYFHQGDLGIIGREAFDLADADTKAVLPLHYLYVCEEGAYELRKQLAFRDFLRERSDWRERLSRLKLNLCVKHDNNRQEYINGKAEMVAHITKLALMEQTEESV